MRWLWVVVLGGWGLGCDDGATADVLDQALQDGGAVDRGAVDGGADAALADMAARDMRVADLGADMIAPDAGAWDCPEDDPVLRTARFRIRNPSDTPRFLPIRGDLCALWRVNDGGRRIPDRVVDPCTEACACIAGTPESWATTYLRLDPGETHEVTWAAQRVERCEREVYCPEFEDTGRPARFNVARPVRRTVAPGAYTLVLAYEPRLPEGCVDDGEPEIACMGPIGANWFDICEAEGLLEWPFELTVDDESIVEVDLP